MCERGKPQTIPMFPSGCAGQTPPHGEDGPRTLIRRSDHNLQPPASSPGQPGPSAGVQIGLTRRGSAQAPTMTAPTSSRRPRALKTGMTPPITPLLQRRRRYAPELQCGPRWTRTCRTMKLRLPDWSLPTGLLLLRPVDVRRMAEEDLSRFHQRLRHRGCGWMDSFRSDASAAISTAEHTFGNELSGAPRRQCHARIRSEAGSITSLVMPSGRSMANRANRAPPGELGDLDLAALLLRVRFVSPHQATSGSVKTTAGMAPAQRPPCAEHCLDGHLRFVGGPCARASARHPRHRWRRCSAWSSASRRPP